MAKAKTPRTTNTAPPKPVITMPEHGAPTLVKKSAPSGDSSSPNLEQAIRLRAYQLYEQRGRTPGHEHEDWFRAEQEVTAQNPRQHTA